MNTLLLRECEAAQPVPLLLERESAQLIGISPRQLARLRRRGQGPAAIRLPTGKIRYRLSDLAAWIGRPE